VKLSDSGGATKVTVMTINGTNYLSSIPSRFGTNQLAAGGTLQVNLLARGATSGPRKCWYSRVRIRTGLYALAERASMGSCSTVLHGLAAVRVPDSAGMHTCATPGDHHKHDEQNDNRYNQRCSCTAIAGRVRSAPSSRIREFGSPWHANNNYRPKSPVSSVRFRQEGNLIHYS
jgi:hypothetical protein